jgi:alpha-tubulin suppressor-like RCC1 family protein
MIDLLPTQLNNIKAKLISCGDYHTMIIDLDNNIWAMGYNRYGQLGLGLTNNRNIPTKLDDIKAKSISCGENHTMIIDLEDNIWAMGLNFDGQLGLGKSKALQDDTNNRYIPTQLPNMKSKSINCGTDHTMIISI